jgi:ribosomal protein S1
VVKGGLLGKLGSYTVFVPASQIRMGYVSNLEEYAGKKLRLKALPAKEEVDEEGNVKSGRSAKRIVASQRIILEAEKIARDEEFWSRIYEGAIVNGKVKRFTDFGAFVSLKYMDALVHNSDLSWTKKRINPADVLEINKAYDFVVLAADRENNKISLGYKQLQKRPIEIAQEKYPVGSIVNGKVVRVVSFGAFVELEEGIDGLVHVSQIKHGWIQSASEALKEGDEVTVKVMSYDNDKITLSIKELLPVEEAPAAIEEEEKEEKPAKSSRKSSEDKPKTRRTRKDRDEEDDEPKEYTSSNSTVTLGDLFNLKK